MGVESKTFAKLSGAPLLGKGAVWQIFASTAADFPQPPGAPRRYSRHLPLRPPPPALPMNHPFRLFRLPSAPAQPAAETGPIATTADVQWNRPVFRAPALPPPLQWGRDLPFTVNFRPKDRAARKSA